MFQCMRGSKAKKTATCMATNREILEIIANFPPSGLQGEFFAQRTTGQNRPLVPKFHVGILRTLNRRRSKETASSHRQLIRRALALGSRSCLVGYHEGNVRADDFGDPFSWPAGDLAEVRHDLQVTGRASSRPAIPPHVRTRACRRHIHQLGIWRTRAQRRSKCLKASELFETIHGPRTQTATSDAASRRDGPMSALSQ